MGASAGMFLPGRTLMTAASVTASTAVLRSVNSGVARRATPVPGWRAPGRGSEPCVRGHLCAQPCTRLLSPSALQWHLQTCTAHGTAWPDAHVSSLCAAVRTCSMRTGVAAGFMRCDMHRCTLPPGRAPAAGYKFGELPLVHCSSSTFIFRLSLPGLLAIARIVPA